MTGLNNYYFSVPSIMLIEDLTFYVFVDRYRNALQKNSNSFSLFIQKLLNPSVTKSL